MGKALTVVMLLAASAAIAAAHPGLLHKGIIGINVNSGNGGNSSEGDSNVMPRVNNWGARRADGDNITDGTKTIKLAHGLITINIAHQQAVIADTNGTATKTISLSGLFNHGGESRDMSGNETAVQTISLHQILRHIATHGGAAAAAAATDGNSTATVKTITLPSIFSHLSTASASASSGDGNATAVTFPHPLASLLSKHASGSFNGGDGNNTRYSQPMMFRRADSDSNSTATGVTKTININIVHSGVASAGDSNSTGHIFSHGRRLNTLGHIIKAAAASGSMGGDSNSTVGSSAGAVGSKAISITINKSGKVGNSSEGNSGNNTIGAGGVSLRIGGGCSCTKDCQPATRKVCRDITRDQASCSDVTSYDVGMSCTKKCFDPSKILAIAHGRRRLLSANSVNTIPHITHGIAKSVIVGGGNGNSNSNSTDGGNGGDMTGNRTASVASMGSSEICKEICKPSVTPVTKQVCKTVKVVESTVCEEQVVGITCTPRCSCDGGNGSNGILSSILAAHHGH